MQVIDLYLPTPEIAAFQWRKKDNFVEQDTCTNIFLAAFTTCHARLKLYDEIDHLGEAVLYMDTDSIIYNSNGENDPPLGDYLGQFTDELDGDTIKTFVSGKSSFFFFALFKLCMIFYLHFFCLFVYRRT